MGFDVIYLPPIHPIGEVNRKGSNNTLTPTPDDVGSPVGDRQQGRRPRRDPPRPRHLQGLRRLRGGGARRSASRWPSTSRCRRRPDHPWAKEHPEWFTTRADGTIAYAENPPKKYQDIYPINFDNDPEGIYAECERLLRLWMSHGVRIFRVDNPHTKPVAFWEWLLGRIRETDPDVLFLSEAFTKPPMMQALATVGFHQSYTYFTWRNTRTELETYLHEVSRETSHVLRPNFFVNTPDILHAFLQYGGPPAFKIRAVVAATGSPSWGVYAGFELFEHLAVQARAARSTSTRRSTRSASATGTPPSASGADAGAVPHPAQRDPPRPPGAPAAAQRHDPLQRRRRGAGLQQAPSTDDDTVIVVLNVDPHAPRTTMVHLNLPAIGLNWEDTFAVHDEITGQDWQWGAHNYVHLDPYREPAHVLSVRRPA